jgi:hypothetical protein
MFDKPNAKDLILVSIMPKPQDLEIARVLGWYRIPLRFAPRVFIIDYFAFYQPASFGDHKWQIEHYAQYEGHELVYRSDLFKNEPKHPNAHFEYFKMQLGPLQTLPSPIRAENWKRLTFMYTNGERFMNANTLSDLKVRDPEEKKVFSRIIRERAKESEQYYSVDPEDEERQKREFRKMLALFGITFDEGEDDELA